MSKKDEFVKAFEAKSGKHPNLMKSNLGEFVSILNKEHDLRQLFRDAVDEATSASEEDQAATGLNQLFG